MKYILYINTTRLQLLAQNARKSRDKTLLQCMLHTLQWIALHCNTLCPTAQHYITLHYIPLHWIALHCTPLHCITLHYVALHRITSHYIALHALQTCTHGWMFFIMLHVNVCMYNLIKLIYIAASQNVQPDPYPEPTGRSIPPIHTETQVIQTDPHVGSPRADPYPKFDATPYTHTYIHT